jgi:hypothetical protein
MMIIIIMREGGARWGGGGGGGYSKSERKRERVRHRTFVTYHARAHELLFLVGPRGHGVIVWFFVYSRDTVAAESLHTWGFPYGT